MRRLAPNLGTADGTQGRPAVSTDQAYGLHHSPLTGLFILDTTPCTSGSVLRVQQCAHQCERALEQRHAAGAA